MRTATEIGTYSLPLAARLAHIHEVASKKRVVASSTETSMDRLVRIQTVAVSSITAQIKLRATYAFNKAVQASVIASTTSSTVCSEQVCKTHYFQRLKPRRPHYTTTCIRGFSGQLAASAVCSYSGD